MGDTYTPGPYHEWINSLIRAGYANLKFLETKVFQEPGHVDATCTVFTFSEQGVLESSHPATDADFDRSAVGKSRRLFVLEGISRAYVESLGAALGIEPEFFASHVLSVLWQRHDDQSDAVMLPSVRKQTRFWTVEYLECVRLNGEFGLGRTRLLPYKPVFRRMFIRSPQKDREDRVSVGLASRAMSFWEQQGPGGNFDSVLLTDIPFKPELSFNYDNDKQGKTFTTTWFPYGSGFVDFANIARREDFVRHSPQYPESRSGSIKDTLLWRLRHPDLFRNDQGSPVNTILQRLALSQWTLTLAFLRRDFYSIDLGKLTKDGTDVDQVKHALQDLTACRQLLGRCSYLLRKNLSALDIAAAEDSTGTLSAADANTDADLLRLDWRFVWQELQHWTNETERFLNLSLANLSVLDSKRGRDDSERSAALSESSAQITKLGQILLLVYTPASFAYGLLSMGGDFSPGNRLFWVFWAISIPLSMFTMLVFVAWVHVPNLAKAWETSRRPIWESRITQTRDWERDESNDVEQAIRFSHK